jgi:DMSO/TMAO reductase YedYZ heme-binding membrane subunit
VSTQLYWYIARATGIIGWALLAGSVLWGLAISTKTRPGGIRPNWMLDLHRFLGGLATIFTGVHVAALVADSYTYFGPSEILVPFASAWRPGAVAWGVAGMYLLAAVELTSLARKRLSKRLWRAVHLASFPLYLTATVHALTAGTDASSRPFTAALWGTTAAVVVLTIIRVVQAVGSRGESVPTRRTAVARGATPARSRAAADRIPAAALRARAAGADPARSHSTADRVRSGARASIDDRIPAAVRRARVAAGADAVRSRPTTDRAPTGAPASGSDGPDGGSAERSSWAPPAEASVPIDPLLR